MGESDWFHKSKYVVSCVFAQTVNLKHKLTVGPGSEWDVLKPISVYIIHQNGTFIEIVLGSFNVKVISMYELLSHIWPCHVLSYIY